MKIAFPPLRTRYLRNGLALAAFVCLLVVAAGLRFYDLPEKSLRYDEAVAANNSSGTLSEVVSNTRNRNSSPILYPLALWAVQKVNVSAFSIRVLPATASVLTVAALLFLLPRAGVSRRAAFLAALLATLSVEAIRHAQDAREYSIDALLAVLMIAGLLQYLRDGRKVLLCVSLFLAPLLQYGLVLFGAAVMGAAMVYPPPPGGLGGAPESNSYLSRIRNWFKPRIALVWPAACLLAACAISYAVTLRYQTDFSQVSYLSTYYYQGKFDVHSIFEFSIDGIWSLLTYHLPEVVAMAALILLAVAFLGKFQGNFQDNAIAVLFLFCICSSVGAAVLRKYPLGSIRQVIYLGPIVFLAAGVSFHWAAGCLSSLMRRGRGVVNAALLVITCGIALAGVSAMRHENPYKTRENIKSVLAVLKERVREEDMVYAVYWTVPAIRFYQGKEGRPANYYYGTSWCKDPAVCLSEMVDLVVWRRNVPNKIFLVHGYKLILEDLELLLGEQVSVEHIIADGRFSLSLIANAKEPGEPVARSSFDVGSPLMISSDFDVYLDQGQNRLIYTRDQCVAADLSAPFFLHVIPVDVDDLPDHRKQYGFDNLDFRFDGYRLPHRCIAAHPLPDYALAGIRTGQYLERDDGSYENFWEAEASFAE